MDYITNNIQRNITSNNNFVDNRMVELVYWFTDNIARNITGNNNFLYNFMDYFLDYDMG
jgi:hypothetical protein